MRVCANMDIATPTTTPQPTVTATKEPTLTVGAVDQVDNGTAAHPGATMKKAGLDEKTAQEIAKKMQTDPAAAKEQLKKELEEQKKQSGDKQQTPEQKKAEEQAKSMCEAGCPARTTRWATMP